MRSSIHLPARAWNLLLYILLHLLGALLNLLRSLLNLLRSLLDGALSGLLCRILELLPNAFFLLRLLLRVLGQPQSGSRQD